MALIVVQVALGHSLAEVTGFLIPGAPDLYHIYIRHCYNVLTIAGNFDMCNLWSGINVI
jgi:hypothetical protein